MLSISTEKNDDDLLPVGNCRRTDAITGGMSFRTPLIVLKISSQKLPIEFPDGKA